MIPWEEEDEDHITVCESNLTRLEDRILELAYRAKCHDEIPGTKLAFEEHCEELLFALRAIRESAK